MDMQFLRFTAFVVALLTLVMMSGCGKGRTDIAMDELVRAINTKDRDTILVILGRCDVQWNTVVRLSDDSEAIFLDHLLKLGDAELVANIADQEGAREYLQSCHALVRAVSSCNLDLVDHFVSEYDSHFNCNPEGGAPPLFWGLGCSTEFGLALIERGADVNFPNEFGCTALHLACGRDDLDMARALLDHGADVNWECGAGTPLHLAVCNATLTQVLLASGATTNARDREGNSPLHLAIYCEHASTLVEDLLNERADANATNNDGEAPLHLAAGKVFVMEESESLLRRLLDAGAKIDACDVSGRTPLLSAAATGQTLALRALVELGADINVTDNEGNGIRELAARRFADPHKASGRDVFEMQQYVESLLGSEPEYKRRALWRRCCKTLRSEYRYNGLNWRTLKRTYLFSGDQQRLMYYSANWQLLEERIDDDWSAQSSTDDRHMQYVWGPRYIDDIIARRETRLDGPGMETWYHLTDAQFSTVAIITDDTAEIVERISYSAYGKARHHLAGDLNGDGATGVPDMNALNGNSGNYGLGDLDRDGAVDSDDLTMLFGHWGAAAADGQLSTTDNIIGYCGYIFNAESPGADNGYLYTVRHRHYEPGLGRWLERDPLGYVDGMGLYEYVRSRPMLVDPRGTGGHCPPEMTPADGWQPRLTCVERMQLKFPDVSTTHDCEWIKDALIEHCCRQAEYTPMYTRTDSWVEACITHNLPRYLRDCEPRRGLGAASQEFICSSPASLLNAAPCAKGCCITHNQCYLDYGCTSDSWLGTQGDACSACNRAAVACIAGCAVTEPGRAYGKMWLYGFLEVCGPISPPGIK